MVAPIHCQSVLANISTDQYVWISIQAFSAWKRQEMEIWFDLFFLPMPFKFGMLWDDGQQMSPPKQGNIERL